MKYRADIDGLRAVAIISVVGFHAYPNYIKGGFTGVDIFFVISGYLITTIIHNELVNGSFALKEFYIRRIRRIFPALLLVLASCLVFGWFALWSDEYRQLGKHVFGGSSFISNFMFWKESGYFDDVAEKKPLLHLWSLAIEEQYYAIWPMLILFLWPKKLNFLVIVLMIALISFIFNVIAVKENISTAFFLPHTRFWELLFGSIVAYLMLNTKQYSRYYSVWDKYILGFARKKFFGIGINKIVNETPSILGGLLITGSIFFITKDFKFPGWWAIPPVMGAGLVILSKEDAWLNRVVLSHPIMVWFGLISFPLYLWHWPIMSFLIILEGNKLSLWIRSLCVLLSLVLAIVTYYFLERPIRVSGNKMINFILILLMTITVVFGYVIYEEGGFSNRVKEDEFYRKHFNWNSSYNSSLECKQKFPGDDYCNISYLYHPPNIAIIGDSHANHFFWGLSEYYKNKNKNLINLGAAGCPPLLGVAMSGTNTSPNCYSRMNRIFNFILDSKSIDAVYISFWHSAYFDSRLIYSDNLGKIQAKDNYEYVLKALERTIMMLRDQGKRVIIIYDMPDLKQDIRDCFVIRPIYPKKSCNLDDSIFIDDFNEYDRLIKNLVSRNKLDVFYTHKFLKGNFPVDKFGVPTYRDYSHLSINGSLFFSDKFY